MRALRVLAVVAITVLMAPLLVLATQAFDAQAPWSDLAASGALATYASTTVVLAFGVGVLCALSGALTAWLVALYEFPQRRLASVLMVLPLAMPGYVAAYAYVEAFAYSGPLGGLLREMFGTGTAARLAPQGVGSAILLLAAVLYPYAHLSARMSLDAAAEHAVEAARMLGRGGLGLFVSIGLPLMRGGLAAGVGLGVMEAVADFGVVRYLEVPAFASAIYREWIARGTVAVPAQLSLLLMVMVLTLLWTERVCRPRIDAMGVADAPRRRRLHGWRGAAALAICLAPPLFGLIVPMALLAARTLAGGMDWNRLAPAFANSTLLGTGAAMLVTALALLLVEAARRGGVTARLLPFAGFGYALPGVVIAMALVATLGLAARHGAITLFGLAGLFLAYAVRFLSVALGPVEAAAARIQPSLEDAARVLGRGPLGVSAAIRLPLLAPSLGAAALLVFVDVVKELPITLVLRPFDYDTLAVETFRLASTERLDAAALPALLIVVIGLVPTVLVTAGRFGWITSSHPAPSIAAPEAPNPPAALARPDRP